MKLAFKRLAAYGIDFFLLAGLFIPLQFLTNTVFPELADVQTGWEIERRVLLTMSLPVWLYFVFCEYRWGQTIGKKVMKLRVATVRGKTFGIGQSILRTFIKLLPWELTHIIILFPVPWWSAPDEMRYLIFIPNALMILYLGVLFWTKGRKSLHDFLPGTEVVPR